MKITLEALIADIADVNGLDAEQQKALFRAVDQFIDEWFRRQGI